MRNYKYTFARMGSASLLAAGLTLSLAGCGGFASRSTTATNEAEESSAIEAPLVEDSSTDAEAPATSDTTNSTSTTTANLNTAGAIDTTDLFTDRDLTQVADTSGATAITLTSGQDVTISEEGVYVITGDATDTTIIVEADDAAKVQLVLDGVTITNEDFPAIYVKSADKVFVTTTAGSTNSLSVTGAFVADGDTNTDAAIFSCDDLVLNGEGTLKVSSTDNGVTCKDDLKVTGGSYEIDATGDALEANDSIAIADGSFTITTEKDALHAEYDEDDTVGYVYICGGSFNITAGDDGIQATTYLQIDGGSFNIQAVEALEGTYVQVNDGELNISASDDGINATTKSQSLGTPTIEIAGGTLAINMGSGDTDAIDSNGNLIISGGTIDITAQSAFDIDGSIDFTGGTVTVNGEQVTEITNSMMMGGGMGMEGGMGAGGGMAPGQGGGMGQGGPGQGASSQNGSSSSQTGMGATSMS